jgi:hydroxymethylglutaryl-CoA lyase
MRENGIEEQMRVVLEDESLRDGLQAEDRLFSLAEKLEIVRLLVDAGVRRLQLGSFVHHRTVPQMANTDTLAAMVRRQFPEVLCTGLVLNEKGLERAVRCGLGHVSMSVSVVDTHSRSNVGRSAGDALETMTGLISAAVTAGIRVRAGVQCAFGAADERGLPEAEVVEAVGRMATAGASEINLADTTGRAHPLQVKHLVAVVRAAVPEVTLSLHLHDTRGLGLMNMAAGYEAGVRLFDVAAGGLGGCPFVPGAAGNVASEDAVNFFHGMGVETGIDLVRLCRVVAYLETLLGRQLPGRMNRALHPRPPK